VIRIGLQRQAFRAGPQFAPPVVHQVLGSPSFFHKKGDPKLVFTLKDGLHYEVP